MSRVALLALALSLSGVACAQTAVPPAASIPARTPMRVIACKVKAFIRIPLCFPGICLDAGFSLCVVCLLDASRVNYVTSTAPNSGPPDTAC